MAHGIAGQVVGRDMAAVAYACGVGPLGRGGRDIADEQKGILSPKNQAQSICGF